MFVKIVTSSLKAVRICFVLYLFELFQSLPIPEQLRTVLRDVYLENSFGFIVGSETVSISPTSGVRQGDPLSTMVFNLALEPVLRVAAGDENSGAEVFGTTVRATAYADDIAVVSANATEQQGVLNKINNVASDLGLFFNSRKCVSMVLRKGTIDAAPGLTINGRTLRALGKESYLGFPIGARFLFAPPGELREKLIKVCDSDLAPWQKLEVFRGVLVPSLSHHLASGKVEKTGLYDLNTACRDFLRRIANVPVQANTAFFYADRAVGGLGVTSLEEDADVWTLARALQLLDSKDHTTRDMAWEQLRSSIRAAIPGIREPTEDDISLYLAGSQAGGMHAARHGVGRTNIWTRARAAASRLKVLRIDVSGEKTIVVADDVSVVSDKAVRGLRSAVRSRWTVRLLEAKAQGRVATGLALDTKSKDTVELTSCRTRLRFADWHQIHRARLGLLPVRAMPGSKIPVQTCRLGCQVNENSMHVVSCCTQNSGPPGSPR